MILVMACYVSESNQLIIFSEIKLICLIFSAVANE